MSWGLGKPTQNDAEKMRIVGALSFPLSFSLTRSYGDESGLHDVVVTECLRCGLVAEVTT